MNMDNNLPIVPAFLSQPNPAPEPEPAAPKKTRASIKAEKAAERAAMLRLAKVIGDLHMNASDPSQGEEAGVQNATLLGQTILRNLDMIVYALRIAGGAANP